MYYTSIREAEKDGEMRRIKNGVKMEILRKSGRAAHLEEKSVFPPNIIALGKYSKCVYSGKLLFHFTPDNAFSKYLLLWWIAG